MRKPSPLPLLLTPALFAIASLALAAPATVGSASPAPTFSAAPGSTTLATSLQAPQPSTTSSAASASGSAAGTAGTTSTNAAGPVTDAASFGPNSSFSNDNGNPELGLSPGQTSSGTLAGTEPSGLDVGSQTLDTNGTFGGMPAGVAAGTVAPVDLLGGAVVSGSGGGTSMGGTAIAVTPGRALASGGSATPLLDQATRNAEQRLARERATGRTPRVIGIAPRTDADRTDEMPDDPIIRY